MATLKVTRQDAGDVLSAHGEEGNALLALATELPNEPAYEGWRHNRTRWIKRTEEALKHIYEGDAAANEFVDAAYPKVALGGASQWQVNLRFDCEYIADAINALISLSERLQYADEPAPEQVVSQPEPATAHYGTGAPVIFLVHGHDHDTRDKVRSFLDRASAHQYEIVILDEQASKGDTVVEKLETHASASQYAVVLLTGDDEGGPRGKPEQFQPRARQNVVLELGWFQGRLGRKKVAVLLDDHVEQPSDIAGLVYISLTGEWERLLARELKAAGFDVTLDRV
jgi:predicted nucleotide-binding protein